MILRLTAATDRLSARIQSRLAAAGDDREVGMVTSEYAMATIVGAGCVGVLYRVVTSPSVLDIIRRVIVKGFHLDFS
jgi:hypothetical protein